MATPRTKLSARPALGAKGTKSGSNLRLTPEAVRNQWIDAELRSIERAAQAHRRKRRAMFSRAELRRAQQIVDQVRRELHRGNMKRGSASAEWNAARDSARARIERALARELPRYREWRKMLRVHQREQQRRFRAVASAHKAGVHVDLADVLPPDSGDTRAFEAPFTIYDVAREDSSVVVTDNSFVVPSIGHVINNVDFEQRDDGPIATDIYGLNWLGRMFSSASCGVNFTTPRAGRVRVGAALQNFHSRIMYSVEDYFGISESELHIEVRLLIKIVQPGRVKAMRKTILTGGLTSYGGDIAATMPLLDTTALHVIEATSAESYEANTGLQVLAGCELMVLSEIDDMRSYVDALLWWQLKKLTIDVI